MFRKLASTSASGFCSSAGTLTNPIDNVIVYIDELLVHSASHEGGRYSRSRRSRSRSASRRSRSPRSRTPASPGASPPRRRPRAGDSRGSPPPLRMEERENPEPNHILGVFGLNFSTTKEDLQREFGKYGHLEKVHVVLDGPCRQSRGFAFIYFKRVEDAVAARNARNGTELQGRTIRVDFSITKEAHKPTPGVYFKHGKATKTSDVPRRVGGGAGHSGHDRGGGDSHRGYRGHGRGGRGGGSGGGPPPHHSSATYREDRGDRYRDRYYSRDHHRPSSSSFYPPPPPPSGRAYYDSREHRYERDPAVHYERDRYYDKYHYPPSSSSAPPRYDDRYRDPYYADKYYSSGSRERHYDGRYFREREYEVPRDKYHHHHADDYDRPPSYDKYGRYERAR